MRPSSRSIDDVPLLMFHGELDFLPAVCDVALFRSCPFKEGSGGVKLSSRGTMKCEHCGKAHVPGSMNGRLCKEWSMFKAAYREMRSELHGRRKYYVAGTTQDVFSEDCDEFMRRYLWNRVKVTILRRDGFSCMECGRSYKELDRGKGRRSGLEVHHIVPRSLGGTDHPGNLKTVCRECHKRHTDTTVALIRDARSSERISLAADDERTSISDSEVDDMAFME